MFDPNNYVQNVLTAARELQQINNQITSLQNEAQMLINQARNLANLPYSSLQQLEQSIQRTQQLLAQAQRIAYDVQQIDRAFSTTYAPASSESVGPGADRRRADALAKLGRWSSGRHAGTGHRRRQHRHQPHADVGARRPRARARRARCRRARPATSSLRCRRSSSPISRRPSLRKGERRALEAAQRTVAQDQGREQLRRFLTPGQGYQSTTVQMFH